jgi:hypothetical protein
MLPGNAKLRVCFLPFVGSKTADGLEVSTVSVDCLLTSPELSLRFCEWSVSRNRLAFDNCADLDMVKWCHFVQSECFVQPFSNGGYSCESLSAGGEEKARPLGA